MSASKVRKQRFFADHPLCCFCGGVVPATTIDHVPNRACFLGRHGPENFEFPACSACQNATRKDEVLFAFLVRMMDFNPANYDPDEAHRAITGMANNHRDLLPNPYLGGVEKRRALEKLGMRKPPGLANADIPLVAVPPGIDRPLRRYGMKIVSALFYREKRRALPHHYQVVLVWGQTAIPSGRETLEAFVRITPMLFQGRRPNLDFGDRFGYRCNLADDPDVFAVIMQFGKGLFIGALVVPPSFASETVLPDTWTEVGTLLAA